MQSNYLSKMCLMLLLAYASPAVGFQMAMDEHLVSGKSGACGATLSFAEFVRKHGRTYAPGSAEYEFRQSLFSDRAASIESHNCGQQRAPWEAGVNHLTDWTNTELKGLLGHRTAPRGQSPSRALPTMLQSLGLKEKRALPAQFSWGNLTSLQDTYDQGNCGNCWAIAATEAMRARAEIKGYAHQFSLNQMTACTPNPNQCGGTGGCDGATAELGYEYVLRAGLVSDDLEFSGLGGERQYCPTSKQVATEKTTKAVTEADGSEVHMLSDDAEGMRGKELRMVGWTKLPENREAPLVQALVEYGPVYVAVAVGQAFFMYNAGVLTQKACDPQSVVNHAVLLYGYGTKQHPELGEVKYWHLKNSWGAQWGEQGSVRLHRPDGQEKLCDWDMDPQMGSGCQGGPAKVWVCGTCGILYDAVVPHFA